MSRLRQAILEQIGVLDSLLNAKSGDEAHDIIVNETDTLEAIRNNLKHKLFDPATGREIT